MARRALLLSMPFGELDVPALGPCLLKSELAARGIDCDIRYFGLEFFARHFLPLDDGIAHYRQLLTGSSLFFVGEWLFAAHLFPQLAGSPPVPPLDDHPGSKHHGHREQYRRSVEFCLSLRREVAPFLERCMSSIPWDQYGVVGFSSSFNQTLSSMALATEIKKRHPEIVLIFGGANAEGKMGHALLKAFPQIDFVCKGEGDLVFPEFVESVLAGRAPARSAGLLGRRDVQLVRAPERLHDLDSLPYPDFTDFCTQSEALGLRSRFGVTLPIESSRGCWWGEKQHCTFCALNGEGMVYRSKSAARLLAELLYLSERYRTRSFVFTDNILDFKYFKDFVPELESRGLDFDLFFETKATIPSARMRLMHRAGIRNIQPGIESLSTHVLELMRKGTSKLKNVECLRNCRTHRVEPTWSHLYGFPGETIADYRDVLESVPGLHHLKPPNSLNPVVVERFAPFFDTPERLGMTNLRPNPLYRSIYPFSDELVGDLAYFFESDHEPPRDPALDELIRGPLSTALLRWRERHAAGADLRAHPCGDHVLVFDSREPEPVMLVLDPFQAAVLRAFDSPNTTPSAARSVAAALDAEASAAALFDELLGGLGGGTAPDVESIVGELRASGQRVEALADGRRDDEAIEARVAAVVRALVARRLLLGEAGQLLALPIFAWSTDEEADAMTAEDRARD